MLQLVIACDLIRPMKSLMRMVLVSVVLVPSFALADADDDFSPAVDPSLRAVSVEGDPLLAAQLVLSNAITLSGKSQSDAAIQSISLFETALVEVAQSLSRSPHLKFKELREMFLEYAKIAQALPLEVQDLQIRHLHQTLLGLLPAKYDVDSSLRLKAQVIIPLTVFTVLGYFTLENPMEHQKGMMIAWAGSMAAVMIPEVVDKFQHAYHAYIGLYKNETTRSSVSGLRTVLRIAENADRSRSWDQCVRALSL